MLDRLGIRRASLCGLSLGGMVSMWLAAHAPERVERLVLCSTSAGLGSPEAWTERAATVRADGAGAVAEAAAARWITPGLAARSPDLLERLTAVEVVEEQP
jgi:pimeloyl-ACP methyl ester carboxylesterase